MEAQPTKIFFTIASKSTATLCSLRDDSSFNDVEFLIARRLDKQRDTYQLQWKMDNNKLVDIKGDTQWTLMKQWYIENKTTLRIFLTNAIGFEDPPKAMQVSPSTQFRQGTKLGTGSICDVYRMEF